ncbi:hypothetical protein ACIA8R_45770 [Nonomuraea sp. NPDC051191]|uniref:hypothetical protein n=1 Tax=Nonomuraea sp. NPDC051191 TaxID=3364372 RepID=UPI0037955427
MSLSVVRDLREARGSAGPQELAEFETDVLAGFVLAARLQARAARAESKLKEQVRELRERLAAAQTAAGLVLPELADLSGDLGEGARGVRLAGAGIAVARQPDGAVGAAPRRPADPAGRRRARRRARPRPGRRSARRLRTLGTRI